MEVAEAQFNRLDKAANGYLEEDDLMAEPRQKQAERMAESQGQSLNHYNYNDPVGP